MPKLIARGATSIELLRCSLQVIRQHKKLVLFPILTMACVVVMVVFFIVPVAFYPTDFSLIDSRHWSAVLERFNSFVGQNGTVATKGASYAYAAMVYLCAMFTATFLNVAFYHEILKGLAGEAISLRRGLGFAARRVRAILLWSLLACTVGLVIQAIAERLGWVGQWIMKFVGIAWSAASVFVIPVLIREESSNPFVLLRNSAGTLRKSWGEAVIGYVGLSAGAMVVVLGWMCVVAVALFTSLYLGPLAAFAFVLFLLVGVAGCFVIGYLSSVAGSIYRCALYVYASEGEVPAPFTSEQMNSAWKVKAVRAS